MKLTVQIIADIIANSLKLDKDHISIYNQHNPIPVDGKLFVSVGMMNWKPYGNNLTYDPTTGLAEKTAQHMEEMITIECMSRDTSAIGRVPEVIGALRSTYAQQMQEQIGFKLASIPITVNDTSFLEGTSILYRTSMTVRVLRAYSQQNAVDYYDTFSTPSIYSEKGEVE